MCVCLYLFVRQLPSSLVHIDVCLFTNQVGIATAHALKADRQRRGGKDTRWVIRFQKLSTFMAVRPNMIF